MEIYFDNSATTKCYDSVRDIVVKTLTEDFGNPSSMHQKGVDGEKYLKDAAAIFAKILKVHEKEIFFTSGGTESNNWALFGGAMANRRAGNHIITTAIEHPAVLEPVRFLETQGFRVTVLSVDENGIISLKELEEALTEDTIIVSTMYVNNEMGAVQPVEAIAKLVHEKCPKALYHVDAIQAFGKYEIFPKRMGIDLLSASGHKVHGPKGVGLLYMNEKVKVLPIIYGGGQQKGMRSGTDNVPAIAGFGQAVKEIYQNREEKNQYLYELKEYMIERLREIENVTIYGNHDRGISAPHIVNVSFNGVGSEVMLHTLEDKKIYVSAGSACSTHKRAKSPTLTAIGAEKEGLNSSVRFSFTEENTKEEIDIVIDVLKQVVPMLRRYRAH